MKLEDFAKNRIEDFEKMEIEDMKPEDLKTLVLNKVKEVEYREFHAEVIKNAEEYLEGRVELVHSPFSEEGYWDIYPGEPNKKEAFYRSFHWDYPHLPKKLIYETIQKELFAAKARVDLREKREKREKEEIAGKKERNTQLTVALGLIVLAIVFVISLTIMEIFK